TAERNALQAQVTSLTAERNALQGQVSTLTAQNSALGALNASLQSQNNALTTQNAALTTENQQLHAQLAAVAPTINGLVLDLFGGKPNAVVTLAARDVALAELIAAKTAAPGDKKLPQAQKAYDAALAELGAGNYQQAVQKFSEAYDTAHKILTK